MTVNYFIYDRTEGLHNMIKGVFKEGFRNDSDSLLKISFVFGIISAPFVLSLSGLESIVISSTPFKVLDNNQATLRALTGFGWLVAGLLIGIGSKLTKGCIGGHGYCASPFYSSRGFFASAVSLAAGIITATLRGWLPFLVSSTGSMNLTY
jgi:uncharacterized membrane protein YedE/YeeE